MKRFRYVGHKRNLIGETAIGKFVNGKFLVQVDRFTHRYSHGWWIQNPKNWEAVK